MQIVLHATAAFTIASLLLLVYRIWPNDAELQRELAVPSIASKGHSLTAVRFLDVGHAQAVLIQGSGNNVLFDGGPSWGAERLLALLQRYDVERIDALFLSRPESEYVGALQAAIQSISIGNVYDGVAFSGDRTYIELVKEMKERGIPYHRLASGDRFILLPSVEATVLTPLRSQEMSSLGNLSANSSLSLIIQAGHVRLLMTGSLQRNEEDALLRVYGQIDGQSTASIQADVIHVARHGARNGTTINLLHSVKPKIAVIQAGAYNEQHLPDLQVLTRLEKLGASIYRTDRDGTVTVWTDGTSWGVETEYGGGDSTAYSVDER